MQLLVGLLVPNTKYITLIHKGMGRGKTEMMLQKLDYIILNKPFGELTKDLEMFENVISPFPLCSLSS